MSLPCFVDLQRDRWVLTSPRSGKKEKTHSSQTAQKAYDTPHPRTRQTWGQIGNGGAFANLGQGRIRHHDTGEGPDIQATADRPQPLVDDDALGPVLDSRPIEAEPVEIRPPPGRDQEVASFDRLLAARAREHGLNLRIGRI